LTLLQPYESELQARVQQLTRIPREGGVNGVSSALNIRNERMRVRLDGVTLVTWLRSRGLLPFLSGRRAVDWRSESGRPAIDWRSASGRRAVDRRATMLGNELITVSRVLGEKARSEYRRKSFIDNLLGTPRSPTPPAIGRLCDRSAHRP